MSRTKNSEIILRIKGKKALIKYYKQVIKRPWTKWITANIYLFEGWLNEAEGELLQLQKMLEKPTQYQQKIIDESKSEFQ